MNRRTFVMGALAIGAGNRIVRSANPPQRSSYTIPAVMKWDAERDTHRPFFPVGWYSFGPWARVEEIAENGANTVLFAGTGTEGWQLGETIKRLDVAKRLGIQVVVGLHGAVVGAVRFGQPSTYGVLPEYVKALNRHPALLGWQLGDEFAAEAAPAVNATTRLLRHLGSKHQTWQVHPHTWQNSDVRTLMAKTDVCTFDGYTYLEGQPEFASAASARVLAWQQAKADLIQSEGWAGNINVTQAVGCKCGDIPFRFPTYREYRWNVFSAIATAGARGTMNWIYAYIGGFYEGNEKRFFEFRDEIVRPVNQEQRRIARAMETGYNVGQTQSNFDEPTTTEIPPATGPYRPYNKVGHILLYDASDKRYFLIVSNNEPRAINVEMRISDLPAPLTKLSARERKPERTLRVSESKRAYRLTLPLQPYDIAICELS